MNSLISAIFLASMNSISASEDVDQNQPAAAAVSGAPHSDISGLAIAVSPFSCLRGRYNLSADYALSESIRIGPKITIFSNNPDGGNMFFPWSGPNHGAEIGIRVTISHFPTALEASRASFFLRPSLYYSNWHGEVLLNSESQRDSNTYLLEVQGLVPEAMVGWRYTNSIGILFEGSVGANLEPTFKASRAGTVGPYTHFEAKHPVVNPLVEFNVGIEL